MHVVCAGRGRGLVATEALVPGQLLLVSKALSMIEWTSEGGEKGGSRGEGPTSGWGVGTGAGSPVTARTAVSTAGTAGRGSSWGAGVQGQQGQGAATAGESEEEGEGPENEELADELARWVCHKFMLELLQHVASKD